MRLFLIRHGETVDNVAQVYAGSRDSELTNHGFQQAIRLSRHLNAMGHIFTHIFSSPLQRALKTAGLIRAAQTRSESAPVDEVHPVPDVKKLTALMEQDFGFYEGKLWYEKLPGSNKNGKEFQRDGNGSLPGFVDVESQESMAVRMDAFLDHHLIPLFDDPTATNNYVVAIVSHGIILSVLWRRLLIRLPPKSVGYAPELLTNSKGFQLERPGGWSNTGYLELHLQRSMKLQPSQASIQPLAFVGEPADDASQEMENENLSMVDDATGDLVASTSPRNAVKAQAGSISVGNITIEDGRAPKVSASTIMMPRLLHGWTTTIRVINGKDHLKGLKRTGGGVGSARHDANQKTIETFFKRRRIS
ncbi:phosphoglycerate mutase-like protein [Lepidopterella palustris CBS 459.81]|uniref:Phosphoglycerate mutase-like protein n=1 Tax=Lepidopterella palustris CBS 459.81 TaxID=1314670 RepID=A0A8E2EAK2_9PEZI|nr:phosphoglycerate mutase-like protein [Lepidopterella palustris CBS 459.81]